MKKTIIIAVIIIIVVFIAYNLFISLNPATTLPAKI
jgi:hypothetical protein